MFNNQSYDEYIRSILGYGPSNNSIDTMYTNEYQPYLSYDRNYMMNVNNQNSELEDCYPEIYKVIYPMIQKACARNTRPVTRTLVDDLTNEIYMSIEGNSDVQININLQNDISSNRADKTNQNNSDVTSNRSDQIQSKNSEDRAPRPINRSLRDIIRILLIRELLGRPGFPGHRPPRPPMRPPFPPGRPPMTRETYNSELNDIYEY